MPEHFKNEGLCLCVILWYAEHNNMTSFIDLFHHPNTMICNQWLKLDENEFGQLFQGFGNVKGMDVLQFIVQSEITQVKNVPYPQNILNQITEKNDPWHTHINYRGSKLDCYGETTTQTASRESIKLLLNIIVLNMGDKGAIGDIGNMYLG